MKPGYLRKGLVKVTHSIVLPKAATRLWFLLLVLLVTSVACAQSAYVATVKTLDKKPGQQELFQQLSLLEPFTRLPDPSAQRDVAETLEWLKTRTDGKGASARYSYAHAAWLWAAGRQEDAAKQYLMAEFQAFWDGTRCADPSAAPARTAQYASTLGRSIVPFLLSADQAVRRRVVGELSPNLGEGFGDNPKDDWLCNGGAAYFRKYAEKHPEFGQQRIGDPSFSGQTIVLTDDTIHPEFISDEEWRVKRKEVADAYLKEVNSMLMMEANESKRPQRNTNGASGLVPSQPVSPGPSEASRSQTLEHQWVIKHRLHHEFGVTVLAMSPSGREVAAGSFLDQRVGMWDVERGTLLRQLKEIKGGARALAYSPDGRFFAAGRDAIKPGDLCVFVYQAGTDTIVQRLQSPAMTTRMAPQGIGAVASLQYSPDSRFLAVGFQGGAIGIYETATGQLKKAVSLSSFLQGPVAYSPNGKYLAFGDRSEEMRNALGPHVIQLLDTETGQVVKTLVGHAGRITALAFDPHGKFLVSGTETGQIVDSLDRKTNQMLRYKNEDPIRIWDYETGMVVKEFGGHTGSVKSLVFYQNGKYMISGSYDKTIKIWDVARGELLSTVTGHNDLVDSIVISSDGKYLVSAGNSTEIKVWERH